jgi:hypothetical protein
VADFDKAILPGKEGKISIKVDGYKLHAGRFKKSFTVRTNDPENPTTILYVTGIVKRLFDFSTALSLSGYANEDLKVESIISSEVDDPINITAWNWDEKAKDYDFLSKNVGVKLETLQKGKQYKLTLWTKGDVEPGQYMGDMVLHTDFKEVPLKKMPFRLVITPDVQIHPATVILREMKITEGTTKSFQKQMSVIAARGDSLKILEVVPDREDISVNVKEARAGKAYQLTISVRPPSVPGKYTAHLKIKTNYPGYEEMDAVIMGYVRVVKEGEEDE